MSRRDRRDRWTEIERDESLITPHSGALGFQGQPAQKSAPAITPLGMSRQLRAFVLACPACPWSSGEASSPTAAITRLLGHARQTHPGPIAESIEVQARSGKSGAFAFEIVDL